MLAMRKAECKVWLEDYMECLHHEKEVSGADRGSATRGAGADAGRPVGSGLLLCIP